PP
ncbi:hypothetical protein J1605_018045, partial [Eschrichtius robustus]